MKEKLELKHVNPYADKALKGLFHGAEDIVTGIDYEHGIISSLNTGSVLIRDFKPFLHPLERLTEPILEGGKIPFEIIENMNSFGNFLYIQNNPQAKNYGKLDWWTEEEGGFEFWEMQNVYSLLLEWHFDVFGLIEKGLAEPIKYRP